MVVRDLDRAGVAVVPFETEAVLAVDSDAVLADPISFEGFEVVPDRGGLAGLWGLKSCRSDHLPLLDEIRVPGFMDQADEVYGVAFDVVADVEGKRAAMFAGKTVRAYVVAAFQKDDGPHGVLDAFVQVAAEAV
jgi:hypothetical protein